MQSRFAIAFFSFIALAAPSKFIHAQAAACPEVDTTSTWVRNSRAWTNETGVTWSNDSLRHVLLSLQDRDQSARADFGARIGDTVYVKKLLNLDSALAAEMDTILNKFGLPTRSMVGPSGSDAAMLIIQHNWPLQERVLALASSLPRGEISPEKIAMLEDRVLVHQGKPQRFGSQFNAGTDGVFRFAPTIDTASLDERRSAAGMPPLKLYVCFLEEAGMRVDRSSLPSIFR
jgi:hypothetical protein